MAQACDLSGGVYRTPLLKNRIPEPEPETSHPAVSGASSLTPAHFDGRLICRLSIDVGGTFTDAVLEDGSDGDRRVPVKVLTTPENPAEGFLEAALRALSAGGRRSDQVRLVLHGTTLATNAILERRGAVTAMVTTEGFRDVLDIGGAGQRGHRDATSVRRKPPLVPRRLRFTVRQRHTAEGKEVQPLDQEGLKTIAVELRAANVESVAVCFLHSYANKKHEDLAATILRTLVPGLVVCTSSAVSPEIREYERFSTTVANAYVQPLMSKYLRSAETKLGDAGIRCPLLLITSGGGLTDADTAARLPVRLIESGPAGGVMLAESAARLLGATDVLSLDMGGTTTKVCVIKNGRAAPTRQFEVDRADRFKKHSGLPLRIPCLDLVEIGGGGGSIASQNAVGEISVGPKSAGSVPGPACYDRGGVDATVTDADVILGLLDAGAFGAGEVNICPELSHCAMQTAVTRPQGLSSNELAAQLVEDLVQESMADAARATAAEHGHDLTRCSLVAFGGAAPLRACQVADRLGISRVVVPPDASVGSAIGFLSAPLAFEALRSHAVQLATFDAPEVNAIFRSLWHETVSVVAAGAARWKPGRPAKERRRAYGRYVGQGRELQLELPNRDFNPDDAKLLRKCFEDAYLHMFKVLLDGEIEIMTWALEVVADSDPVTWNREHLQVAQRAGDIDNSVPAKRSRPLSVRSVFDGSLGKMVEVPLFWREALPVGTLIEGPAVVAEAYTSTMVTTAFQCRVLETGFLDISRRELLSPGRTPGCVGCVRGISQQLMWSRLRAIVEEQAQTLLRTAFSPVIREAGAVACGTFDGHGRLLAVSDAGTPGLVGALHGMIGRFLEEGVDVTNGCSMVCNDPWVAAGDLRHLTVITPVFSRTREDPVAFVASVGETADMEIVCEGPRVLTCHGTAKNVVAWIQEHSTQPKISNGDFFAMLAANTLGCQRIGEVLTEFDSPDLRSVGEHICEFTKTAVAPNILEVLPGGPRKGEVVLDVSGHGAVLRLGAQLRVSDGTVEVQLEPSWEGPRDQGVPEICTRAHVTSALVGLFARDLPLNDGVLRVFRIAVPPRTVVSVERLQGADHSKVCMPDIAYWLPSLIACCVESGLAPSAGSVSQLVVRVPAKTADSTFAMHEGAGGGASAAGDGITATTYPTGLWPMPTEVLEASAPVLVKRRDLRCDSGGVGQMRGGLGVRFEIAPRSGALDIRASLGHKVHAPEGLTGEGDGSLAAASVGDIVVLSVISQLVPLGTSFIIETAGGRGWGPASSRTLSALLEDVADGLVSQASAVSEYGLEESVVSLVQFSRSGAVQTNGSHTAQAHHRQS